MDNFVKLMRVRFSGAGQGNAESSDSSKDRQLVRQKTQSFTGEKKGALNWLQRQFFSKMNWSYNANNDVALAIAVAATAYSIESIQQSSIRDQKINGENQETSLSKPVRRKGKAVSIREPSTESKQQSGEDLVQSSEMQESKEVIKEARDEKAKGKATGPAPSVKRRPTFAGETSRSSSEIKPESYPSLPPEPEITEQPVFPRIEPGTSTEPSITGKKSDFKTPKTQKTSRKPDLPSEKPQSTAPKADQGPVQPVAGQTKADVWEKAEMKKIKEQYEKQLRTINTWENKRKTKARHKLDRIEQELERRRAKASQNYKKDMEYINQVAQGARAQAEERLRNKELEAKDEANKIRKTGKVPSTCFCC